VGIHYTDEEFNIHIIGHSLLFRTLLSLVVC